jgi:hypothetical protein
VGLEDGRVVDEDVDPAHLACDAFDEAPRRVRVGHVRSEDSVRPSAQGGECLLRRLTVGAVVNGHPHTFCREPALSRILCRAMSPSPAPPSPISPPIPLSSRFATPRRPFVADTVTARPASYNQRRDGTPSRAAEAESGREMRLDKRDHRSSVLWATDYAEHVLPYFEEKHRKTTDLGMPSKQGVPGCVVRLR